MDNIVDESKQITRLDQLLFSALPLMFLSLIAVSALYVFYGANSGVAVRPMIMFYAFLFIIGVMYMIKKQTDNKGSD